MKDLVSIVLATYKPNEAFLVRQLKSLNAQTYRNIELLVCDDSADNKEYKKISTIVKENVTNFPFSVYRNQKNMGSNKTFERLSTMASGKYIAYCDQDDIWNENKIKQLVKKIELENAVLCYSDLAVINENDEIIANSFKKFSTRLKHIYGSNKYGFFLRRNSVTGCAMLIKREVVEASLPFPDYNKYVHDHWLALWASSMGKIAYIKTPLINYRIHSSNQIGNKVLDGIVSKEDYLNKKILKEIGKAAEARNRKVGLTDISHEKELRKFEKFVEARVDFFKNKNIKTTLNFLKKIHYDPSLIIFELIINFLPDNMSRKVLKLVKN